MDDDLKKAVTATDTWIRLLFMILFAFLYALAELVIVAVVVLQFFFVLFTREKNDRLLDLGEDLGVYIFQMLQFQTFNSEEKPFPFGPWPYGSDEGIDDKASAEVLDKPKGTPEADADTESGESKV